MAARPFLSAKATALALVLSLAPRVTFAQESSHVEIDSPNPNVTLNQITGESFASASGPGGYASASGQSWATVCIAPCGKTLPRGAYYFVDGPGMPRSGKFLLPPGEARLHVKPGSSGPWAVGLVLLSLGGSAVIVGGSLALVGSISTYSKGMATPGFVLLGVGGVATIVGAILMAKNTTDVLDDHGVVLGRKSGTRLTPGGLLF